MAAWLWGRLGSVCSACRAATHGFPPAVVWGAHLSMCETLGTRRSWYLDLLAHLQPEVQSPRHVSDQLPGVLEQ